MIFFKGSDLCFAGHKIRFAPEDLRFDEINEESEVADEIKYQKKRHANVHPVFREILEEISDERTS